MTEPAKTELSQFRLQELLLAHQEPEDFMKALAGALAGHLADWDVVGTSIIVVRPRRQVVRVGSQPCFALPNGGQPEGDPASGVLASGLPVVVRHLDAHYLRRGGGSTASEAGMAAFASVPVPVADAAGAVLTAYATRPGAFGPEAVRAVERAAAEAAPVLTFALRTDAQTHRANNLQAALESRTVVDLAAGIIMAQNNCSQQSAVEILRSVSNSRNVKIREVAAGVVSVVSDRVSTHFEE
ncbi:GAF domain-containing protein [Arthrobacter sp. UYP6]|uniref:ANTAR domain-containing protein n=1 Tax=Arthrobacter sp. UYP6 TaxID=1756378 RepID=UPI0033920EA1